MATRFLVLEAGIPKMRNAEAVIEPVYSEDYDVTETITAGTPISLPNAGTFNGIELKVSLNGLLMTTPGDYIPIGSSAPYSQISFTFDLVSGDSVLFRKDRADEDMVYNAQLDLTENINAGVSVSLPNGEQYNSSELQIFLNGAQLEYADDYIYVGVSAPRSQVQFLFDLYSGDTLVFRKDRDFT